MTTELDSASVLVSEVVRFLRKPVIKLEMMPSDEVYALQLQVQSLMKQLEDERKRYQVLEERYGREVYLNCHYEDLFRLHGIKFR